MVRHGTARQKFCSYKTEESLQVEPQSNSNFYGSARRGTTYKTGLRLIHLRYFIHLLPSNAGNRASTFLKPAAHGEENAQQSGMNVILLSKILAVCG